MAQFNICKSPDAIVCYDFTGLLPTAWDDDSVWMVDGVDRLVDECEIPPVLPGSADYTFDWNSGGFPTGVPNWNTATYQTIPPAVVMFNPMSTSFEVTGDPADGWACSRPSLRFFFPPVPVGCSCPVTLNMTFNDPTTGFVFVHLWDTVQQINVPIDTITTSGIGPNAGTVTPSPNGDVAYIWPANGSDPNWSGPASILYDCDATFDPANFQVIITGLGNFPPSGLVPENIEINGMDCASTLPTNCCFLLNDLNDVAGVMSDNDPNGNVWFVSGERICTNTNLEVGGSYAQIDFDCDGIVVSPSVVRL